METIKKEHLEQLLKEVKGDKALTVARHALSSTDIYSVAYSKDNEKELLGRTEQDELVVFEADKSLIGSFVDVKLLELTGNTFKGTL